MTHAAARHRALDHRFADALATDGEPSARGALLPSRLRAKDARSMSTARVLLTTLSVRTSAKGRPYLSGFLGKSPSARLQLSKTSELLSPPYVEPLSTGTNPANNSADVVTRRVGLRRRGRPPLA